MREIEIKFKLFDSVENVRELLEGKNFIFEPEKKQEDIVYMCSRNYDNFLTKITSPVLRIRLVGNENIFTLKKSRSNELDSIEYETHISDKDSLDKIIKLLDYKEIVRVDKTRFESKNKDISICLDRVAGLGDFIELEKITDEKADPKVIQRELKELFLSWGIGGEEVTKGYDSLLFLENKHESR